VKRKGRKDTDQTFTYTLSNMDSTDSQTWLSAEKCNWSLER